MASLMGLPIDRHPSLNLSPQKLRERTIDAVVEHIARLSKRQPVLLTVEDAHWIDATTQEVLDLLTSRIASLPALLLVTYRPEYQPRWSGEPQVTILTLSRLSRRLGAQLVSEVCAGKTLPQELLDQIAAKTDGVPLFVEELTKAVLESGLVRDQGVRYELVRALSSVPIPATLRDSLMARLDRFASTKEIAQIGACIRSGVDTMQHGMASPL